MNPRLLILDLDGTVRRCTVPGQPCPNRPGEQTLLPGVGALVKAHLAGGGRLAWATNQGGIGVGYMTARDHLEIERELHGMLADAGAVLPWSRLGRFTCPHAPRAGCRCRKPAPGMLRDALAWAGARPSEALFIGDRDTDAQAAARAGVAFAWAWAWNPRHPADLRPRWSRP